MYNEEAEKAVTPAALQAPDERTAASLAELFSMFGDTTRIKILCALSHGDMCVNEIAQALSMTQSAISHQLKTLRHSRLVGTRRDGKTVVYFLADDHVRTIINCGTEHLSE